MKNSIIPMPVSQHRGGFFVWAAAVLWTGFVFVQFFLHLDKTFSYWGLLFDVSHFASREFSQQVPVWMNSFQAVLVTVLVWGATGAAGSRVRWVLGLSLSNFWLTWAFDFGLGAATLGFFWVGTGLCGLWFAPLWWSAAVLLLLLWAWDIFAFWRNWTEREPISIAWGHRFLFFCGVIYVILAFLVDLTPETFYDSMVYHLAVPQYWLFHHGLSDFSTNFFSNYPYGAETFFLNGLVFQGVESAKMLHIAAWVMVGVLAAGWVDEISGGKAGFLALGLMLTLPLFSLNVWTTQVEGFLTLMTGLAVYALTQWVRVKDERWAWMAGLFAGLTLGIKYNGVIVIGCALVVAAFRLQDLYAKDRWKQWLFFAAALLLSLGPWLIKNWVYTGNPLFPYLSSLFQGRHLPADGYARLLTEQQGRMTNAWWEWLLLPWKIVMSNPDSYSFAGPVALMFIPLLFLFRFKHPQLRFLVWTAGLVFVVSLAVTHILRFMAPDFLLLYVLLASVLAGGDRPFWGRAAAWVAGLCALLCIGYLADIIHYYYDFAGILSGRQTQGEYLDKKLTSYHSLSQWLSVHLPEDKRLLIVGDARGLYYSQSFITNTVFDAQVLAQAAKEAKDAEGISQKLRELGVDYLVINGLEGIRVSADYHHYDLTTAEWKRLDDFIQRGTKLVYSQNLQAVYGLLSKFQPKPKDETMDLVLFFSAPASRFMVSLQKQDDAAAQESLKEAVKLYPFSSFWKKENTAFQRRLGTSRTENK